MPDDTAAWIRGNAWRKPMRKDYAEHAGYIHHCACQWGVTTWCEVGNHKKCVGGLKPRRTTETAITSRGGGCAVLPEPYRHLVDTSATRPKREQYALVWLADRVCRWACPCTCHSRTAYEELLRQLAERQVENGLF